MEWKSHNVPIVITRARTITVDVSRGGDYALADYHRQCDRFGLLMRLIGDAKAEVVRTLQASIWRDWR